MRILYIDVDSLRPDHLGCYGYHRSTSPNIDELAGDGRQFTNFYAADAPCLPSRTGLFLSRFGIHTGVINHGGLNADPRPYGRRRWFRYPESFRSWMTVLGNEGIRTASVSPFPSRHDAWQVLEGVTDFRDPRDSSAHAAELYPYAADWLDEHAAEDDWFLHVNFWDPHTAYNTPMEYGNPFEDEPAPAWMDQARLDEQYELLGPHGAFNPPGAMAAKEAPTFPRMPQEIATLDDFTRWIDGYDVGVRFMDDHVGKLVDLLREQGVFEETLVIISADHGENLGELNVYGDHQTADEHTCNVPLIIRGPGVEAGIDRDFHYQLDLAPTVSELVGAEIPTGWDGRSFASSLTEGSSVGRDYVVTSQGAWACQRGVRWNDWLLLRTYHDGMKAALSDVMLFDLATDPHETTNLAADRPEIVTEGLSMLQKWVDERLLEAAEGRRGGNPDAPEGVTDPMWNVIREGGPFHSQEYLENYLVHLRDRGREEQAATLADSYAG